NAEVMARRIDAFTRLAAAPTQERPRLIITTANAALQRVPRIATLRDACWSIHKGAVLAQDKLNGFLAANGYSRAEQVMEPGEYAVRGGLIDVYPPGVEEPVRIDLFGDEIEALRT